MSTEHYPELVKHNHIITPYSNIHFNIILPSTPRSQKWFFPQRYEYHFNELSLSPSNCPWSHLSESHEPRKKDIEL
jgi:hypothetical protein